MVARCGEENVKALVDGFLNELARAVAAACRTAQSRVPLVLSPKFISRCDAETTDERSAGTKT